MKMYFILKEKGILLFLLILLCLTSCSKDNEEVELLKLKKVEAGTIPDVMSQLVIEADGDKELLCRVLGCSLSTFNRLLSGESNPTEHADREIRNLLRLTYEEGYRAVCDKDPADRWFEYLKRLIDACPIWLYIIGICIVGFILVVLFEGIGLVIDSLLPIFLLLFRFGIYYLLIWWYDKPEMVDNFKTTLDSVWEMLI